MGHLDTATTEPELLCALLPISVSWVTEEEPRRGPTPQQPLRSPSSVSKHKPRSNPRPVRQPRRLSTRARGSPRLCTLRGQQGGKGCMGWETRGAPGPTCAAVLSTGRDTRPPAAGRVPTGQQPPMGLFWVRRWGAQRGHGDVGGALGRVAAVREPGLRVALFGAGGEFCVDYFWGLLASQMKLPVSEGGGLGQSRRRSAPTTSAAAGVTPEAWRRQRTRGAP